MKFIQVKNQDGIVFNINVENICWMKDISVGYSHAVTIQMKDSTPITAIMTLDSLRKLQKMMNIERLY